MFSISKISGILFFLLLINCLLSGQVNNNNTTLRPWLYWHNGLLDTTGVAKCLQTVYSSGFGGIHITTDGMPPSSSSNELGQLAFLGKTIREAKKLNLGVDVNLSTSPEEQIDSSLYPFLAKKLFIYSIDSVRPDTTIRYSIDSVLSKTDSLLAIFAISEDYTKQTDITWLIDKTNYTDYFAPGLGWRIFIFAYSVSDPSENFYDLDYLTDSSVHYLLDKNLSIGYRNEIRSMSPFSISLSEFTWSNNFLAEFKKRRKYDLRSHLYLFIEDFESEIKPRVLHDYYLTIADLYEESFMGTLKKWVQDDSISLKGNQFVFPGNIIDCYSNSTIPLEKIGEGEFNKPLTKYQYPDSVLDLANKYYHKFTVSASNVSGNSLVAANLNIDIHKFQNTPSPVVKVITDQLFASGINHLFMNMESCKLNNDKLSDPNSEIHPKLSECIRQWKNINELNTYITKCQAILQHATPDNDVLVYLPFNDFMDDMESKPYADEDMKEVFLDWFDKSSVGELSYELDLNGYTFDYISDKQLLNLNIHENSLYSSNGTLYKLIIFPKCSKVPLNSLYKVLSLAEKGGDVVFVEGLPKDVSGFYKYKTNRMKLLDLKYSLFVNQNVSVVKDLDEAHQLKKIFPEKLSYYNIDFIRKNINGEKVYFIVNNDKYEINEWIELSAGAKAYWIYEPVSGRDGYAEIRDSSKVRIQLKPGQSWFLLGSDSLRDLPSWTYRNSIRDPYDLRSSWKITFPENPGERDDTLLLASLNDYEIITMDNPDRSEKIKYEASFNLPSNYKVNEPYMIRLSGVDESVEVFVNNSRIGKVWSYPFEIMVQPKKIQKRGNRLELVIDCMPKDINQSGFLQKVSIVPLKSQLGD